MDIEYPTEREEGKKKRSNKGHFSFGNPKCTLHMSMSSEFCGVPCALPNQWELHLQLLSRWHTNSDVVTAPASSEAQQCSRLVPQLRSLNFYADFYNEHHACCWPRTLLDTHMGQAAEAMAHESVSERAGTCLSSQDETTSPAGAVALPGRTDVLMQHVSQVAEQLFHAQQDTLPRAQRARRIVYHCAVPPVLRCSGRGDSLVYLLEGQMVLWHRCRGSASAEKRKDNGTCKRARPAGGGYACTHAQHSDALARDVFPLFLVMAPSTECAAYVDSETGSASEASQWRSRPLALALESVTRADEEPFKNCDDSDGEGEPSVGNESGGKCQCAGVSWYATYSSFSWLCNPLGNQHASSLVRTNATVPRVQRCRLPTKSGAAPVHKKGKRSAAGQLFGGDGATTDRGNSVSSNSGTGAVAEFLPPLSLAFDLYATVYTSDAARRHILTEMQASQFYTPHVTQTMRFGFGGSASAEAEAAEWQAGQLAAARSRRPGQLMRLLETKMKCRALITPCSSARSCVTDAEAHDEVGNVGTSTAAVGERNDNDDDSPPRKAACHTFPESDSTGQAQSSWQVFEVPCVRTVLLGTLCTRRPVTRERCAMSKGTTLVSVLRKRSQCEGSVAASVVQKPTADEPRGAPKEDWPLRVRLDSGTSVSPMVVLSPLSSLQDLSNAFRSVSQ